MMETTLVQKEVAAIEVLSAEETKRLMATLGTKESLLNEYAKKAEAAAQAAEAALTIANKARDEADNAKREASGELKIGLFNKKEAINDVKGRVVTVAEAVSKVSRSQIDLAKAQAELTKAQKASFECQKKIAEISVAMVQLGCTSIANSRIVVRQLEARLEGASEEELNDLARAELQNVVMQIREQQDVLARQDQLTRIIHGHEESLRENMRADSERDKAIVEQMRQGLERDKKIAAQARRSEEHHKVLVMQNKRTDEISRVLKQHEKIAESIQQNVTLNANRVQAHSQLLEQNVQVIKALALRIGDAEQTLVEQGSTTKDVAEQLTVGLDEIRSIKEENVRRDTILEEHGNRVSTLEKAVEAKEEELKALRKTVDALQTELQKKASKVLLWFFGGVSIVALILTVINFFI